MISFIEKETGLHRKHLRWPGYRKAGAWCSCWFSEGRVGHCRRGRSATYALIRVGRCTEENGGYRRGPTAVCCCHGYRLHLLALKRLNSDDVHHLVPGNLPTLM